jgi:hypothetical protein
MFAVDVTFFIMAVWSTHPVVESNSKHFFTILSNLLSVTCGPYHSWAHASVRVVPLQYCRGGSSFM